MENLNFFKYDFELLTEKELFSFFGFNSYGEGKEQYRNTFMERRSKLMEMEKLKVGDYVLVSAPKGSSFYYTNGVYYVENVKGNTIYLYRDGAASCIGLLNKDVSIYKTAEQVQKQVISEYQSAANE